MPFHTAKQLNKTLPQSSQAKRGHQQQFSKDSWNGIKVTLTLMINFLLSKFRQQRTQSKTL